MFKSKGATFWLAVTAIALIAYQVRLLAMTERYVGLQDLEVLTKDVLELKSNVIQSHESVQARKDQLEAMQGDDAENEIAKHMREEIDRYKMLAGFTDVTGEGVLIIIDDGNRELMETETPNDLVVHDLDIRTLVDDLRVAGAEAISVNGTRIIMGVTEIVCNGPTIRINGIQQAQPYIIRAIGDRYSLEGKLKDTESYAHALKQIGLEMDVNTRIALTVERHSVQTELRYAKPQQ